MDRYDGYDFKVYKHEPGDSKSIGANRTIFITEDKDHNIWIAQWNGISRFDRKTETFKNYNLNQFAGNFISTTPKVTDIYCDSHNNIWAGEVSNRMSGGTLKYDRKSDRFYSINFDSSNSGSDNRGPNAVQGICEYRGKIWALSWNHGLCYYDPDKNLFEARNFLSSDKPVHLTNFKVPGNRMYPDRNGYLWIVTVSGIYKYNSESNRMSVVNKFSKTVNSAPLLGIAEDKNGNLWTGYASAGLFKFDGISNNFKSINYNGLPSSTDDETTGISSLCFDNSGVMWIGTMGQGIFKYDPTGEPFTNFNYDRQNKNSLSGDHVSAIYQSRINKDLIYVGTQGAGIDKFYPAQNKFDRINFKSGKDNTGISVNSFSESKNGSLYIGTEGSGLFKYTAGGELKLVEQNNPASTQSLSSNFINVLEQDPKGQIWIGTNFGLDVYNPATNKIDRISDHLTREYPPELMNLIRSKENTVNVVQSILKVGNNQNRTKELSIAEPGNYLCVSVGEGGLLFSLPNNSDFGWIENEKGDTVWSAESSYSTYYLGGSIKNVISADIVKLLPGKYKLRYVTDDSHAYGQWNATPPADSTLWGIEVLKLNGSELHTAESILSRLKDQPLTSGWNIQSIHIDFNGIVWIGTNNNGLTEYNPGTEKTKYFKSDPKNHASLSSNSIRDIYQDDNGILWLATQMGLDKFDPVKETFTTYTERDGLATNNLTSVLGDGSGNLWISTLNGISRMTIDKSAGKVSFVNFDTRDGLGGTTFHYPRAAVKGSDGKIYFGCDQGLTGFSPGSFNNSPPIVQITDIKLSNVSVTSMGKDDPLNAPVMSTKEVTLNSSQNNISFEFAALHYSQPEKNEYSHILEGYDKTWNHDNRRFASYTNLDPGKYVFKVRASNSDGVWNNKGASITILILPPWWKTGWAYAGYILLFAGLIFSIDRFQRKRLLTKERARQKINEMELRAKAAEAESRALELENKRKTKELEEARQLQLSMLPKKIPNLPHLDIAVYMKTATEVGGDYYDFHLHTDGTLTVILGDATGHGMQSGMMVSIMKSLFMSDRTNKELKQFFENAGAAIKDMHLGRLMMALNCVQISNGKIITANAGMPPLVIYRDRSQTVEEVQLNNMPLGAMKGLSYKTKELEIEKGDTLLMMSDGFAELKNANEEQYGYRRARSSFEESARKEPEEIVTHLKNIGINWTNKKEPEDDVTFVVIKVK